MEKEFARLYNLMDDDARRNIDYDRFKKLLRVPKFRNDYYRNNRGGLAETNPQLFNRKVVYDLMKYDENVPTVPVEDGEVEMSFEAFNNSLDSDAEFRVNFFKNNMGYHGTGQYDTFQKSMLYPEKEKEQPKEEDYRAVAPEMDVWSQESQATVQGIDLGSIYTEYAKDEFGSDTEEQQKAREEASYRLAFNEHVEGAPNLGTLQNGRQYVIPNEPNFFEANPIERAYKIKGVNEDYFNQLSPLEQNFNSVLSGEMPEAENEFDQKVIDKINNTIPEFSSMSAEEKKAFLDSQIPLAKYETELQGFRDYTSTLYDTINYLEGQLKAKYAGYDDILDRFVATANRLGGMFGGGSTEDYEAYQEASKEREQLVKQMQDDPLYKKMQQSINRLNEVSNQALEYANNPATARAKILTESSWEPVARGKDLQTALENAALKPFEDELNQKITKFKEAGDSVVKGVYDPFTGGIKDMTGEDAAKLYEKASDEGLYVYTNEEGVETTLDEAGRVRAVNNFETDFYNNPNQYGYQESMLGTHIVEKSPSYKEAVQEKRDAYKGIEYVGYNIASTAYRGGGRFIDATVRSFADIMNLGDPRNKNWYNSIWNGLTQWSGNLVRDTDIQFTPTSDVNKGIYSRVVKYTDPDSKKDYTLKVSSHGEVLGVFNDMGMAITPSSSFRSKLPKKEEIQKLPIQREFSWAATLSTSGDVGIDLASLVVGGKMGTGILRAVKVPQTAAVYAAQTNFVRAQMSGTFEQEALDAGMTMRQARAYAASAGTLVGIVNLIGGPTTRAIGAKSLIDRLAGNSAKFWTKVANTKLTPAELAVRRIRTGLLDAGGEMLEEGLFEPLVTEGVQRWLSPDRARFEQYALTEQEYEEVISTAVVSGLVGGIMGGAGPMDLQQEAADYILKDNENYKKYLEAGKKLGYTEEELQKTYNEIKEKRRKEIEDARAKEMGRLGVVDPDELYTFRFNSTADVPKELRHLVPADQVTLAAGNESQIILSFTGQQLIDAKVAKVDTLAVKERDARAKIRSLETQRQEVISELEQLEAPIREREERNRKLQEVENGITEAQSELERLSQERNNLEATPINPDLNQDVQNIRNAIQETQRKRDEAAERFEQNRNLPKYSIRFNQDGSVEIESSQGDATQTLTPEELAQVIESQTGRTDVTQEKIVAIANKIKNNEQLSEDEKSVYDAFFNSAQQLQQEVAQWDGILAQLGQQYQDTRAVVQQALEQQRTAQMEEISTKETDSVEKRAKLEAQQAEINKTNVRYTEDIEAINDAKRRIKEFDDQIVEAAQDVMPELLSEDDTIEAERKRQAANVHMQGYFYALTQDTSKDVGKKEYANFKKDNTVTRGRMATIARKLLDGDTLTTREQEIYDANTARINEKQADLIANRNGVLTENQINELQELYGVTVLTPEMRRSDEIQRIREERNRLINERNTLQRQARQLAARFINDAVVANNARKSVEVRRAEELNKGGNESEINARYDRMYFNEVAAGNLTPTQAALAMQQAGRTESPVFEQIQALQGEIEELQQRDPELYQELLDLARETVDNMEYDSVLFQDSMFNMTEEPIGNISTDEARFQNREKLNEAALKEMIENFDPNKFDPIVAWRDANGQLFVLAGHHRLEAAKANGIENVPIRIFQGNEAEAIEYATQLSNAISQRETSIERASIYRKDREAGMSKKDMMEKAKKLEGRNALYILRLSALNPNGKLYEAVRLASKSTDQDAIKELEQVANWVGAARMMFPQLTNAHEQEMFDFLSKNAGKTIKNQNDFLQRMNGLVQSLFFNVDEPLNLERIKYKNAGELEYERQLAEVNEQIKEVQDEMNALEARFTDVNAPDYIPVDTPGRSDMEAEKNKKIGTLKIQRDNLQKKKEDLVKSRSKMAAQGNSQLDLFNAPTDERSQELTREFPQTADALIEAEKQKRAEEAAAKTAQEKQKAAERHDNATKKLKENKRPQPIRGAKRAVQTGLSALNALDALFNSQSIETFLAQNEGKPVVINGRSGILNKVNENRFEVIDGDVIYEVTKDGITTFQQGQTQETSSDPKYRTENVTENSITVNGVDYIINTNTKGNVVSVSPKNNPKQRIKNERLLIAVEIARNKLEYQGTTAQEAEQIIQQIEETRPDIAKMLNDIWDVNFTETIAEAIDKLADNQKISEEEALQVGIWLSDVFDRISMMLSPDNTVEEKELIVAAYNMAETLNTLLYFSNNVTLNEKPEPRQSARNTKQVETAVVAKKSKSQFEAEVQKIKDQIKQEQSEFDQVVNELADIIGEEAILEMLNPLYQKRLADAQELIRRIQEQFGNEDGTITEEGKEQLVLEMAKLELEYQKARRAEIKNLPTEVKKQLAEISKKLNEVNKQLQKEFGKNKAGIKTSRTLFGPIVKSVDYTVTYKNEESIPDYIKQLAGQDGIKDYYVADNGEVSITLNSETLIKLGLAEEQVIESEGTETGTRYTPKNRQEVVEVFVTAFDMPIEEAQRSAMMIDATATAWATRNKKPKADFYTEKLGGIEKKSGSKQPTLNYNPNSEGSSNILLSNLRDALGNVSDKARALESWIDDIIQNSDVKTLRSLEKAGVISLSPEWVQYEQLSRKRRELIANKQPTRTIDNQLGELKSRLPEKKFTLREDFTQKAQSFLNENADALDYDPTNPNLSASQVMDIMANSTLNESTSTSLFQMISQILPLGMQKSAMTVIDGYFSSAVNKTFNKAEFVEALEKIGVPTVLAGKMANFFNFKKTDPPSIAHYQNYYTMLSDYLEQTANRGGLEAQKQRADILEELNRVTDIIDKLSNGQSTDTSNDVVITTQDGSVFMVVNTPQGVNIVRAEPLSMKKFGSPAERVITLGKKAGPAIASIPLTPNFTVYTPTPEERAGALRVSTSAMTDEQMFQAMYGVEEGAVTNNIFQRILNNTAKRMGISYDALRQKMAVAKGRMSPREFYSSLNTMNNENYTDFTGSPILFQSAGPLSDFTGIPENFLSKVQGIDPNNVDDQLLYQALSLFPDLMGYINKTRTTAQSDALRAELNAAQGEIGQLYKQGRGKEANALKERVKALKQEIKQIESAQGFTKAQVENLLHEKIAQLQEEVNSTNKYVITEFSDAFLANRIQMAKEQGEQIMVDAWERIRDNEGDRRREIEGRQQSQRNTFNESFNYLVGHEDYSVGFIALALNEVLTKGAKVTYKTDAEGNIIRENNKAIIEQVDVFGRTNTTFADPMIINGANAPTIYQKITEGDTASISEIVETSKDLLYAPPEEIMQRASKYIVEKRPGGVWIKIPQNGTDKDVENLEILARDTHRTGGQWCTGAIGGSTASQHNQGGDFYMFIDNSGTVRLGARMMGQDKMAENIRGLAEGQGVEGSMAEEAEYFLTTNPAGKEYLKHTKFNKLYYKYVEQGQEFDPKDKDDLLEYYNAGDGSYRDNSQKIDDLTEYIKRNNKSISKTFGYNQEVFVFDESDVNVSHRFLLSNDSIIIDKTINVDNWRFLEIINTSYLFIETHISLTKLKKVNAKEWTIEKNLSVDLPSLEKVEFLRSYSDLNLPNLLEARTIFSFGNTLKADKLKSINVLNLKNSKCSLLKLEELNSLYIKTDKKDSFVDLPVLKKINKLESTIETGYNTRLLVPSLQEGIDIEIDGKVELPSLKKVMNLKITNLTKVPSLKKVNFLLVVTYGQTIDSLDFPNIEEAFKIRINEKVAEKINLPKLKKANEIISYDGVIKADNLEEVNDFTLHSGFFPKLKTLRQVEIKGEAKFPEVRFTGKINIDNNGFATFPKLRKVIGGNISIWGNGAGIFPSLQEMGGLYYNSSNSRSQFPALEFGLIRVMPKSSIDVVSPYLASQLEPDKYNTIADDIKYQNERAAFIEREGKYYIYLSKDSDITSPLHEAAHLYEKVLTPEEKQKILKWAGHSKWTRETSEAFARGFEKYLYEGTLDKQEETIFKKFQSYLKNVIENAIAYFGGVNELNQDMVSIYSMMVGDVNTGDVQVESNDQILFQDEAPEGLNRENEDGKFVFEAMTGRDLQKPLEDLAKTFEQELTRKQIKDIEKWSGEKFGTPGFTESLQRGFQDYVESGRSPSKQSSDTFGVLGNWLQSLYNNITDRNPNARINAKMENIFEQMMNKEMVEPTRNSIRNMFPKMGNVFSDVRSRLFNSRENKQNDAERQRVKETRSKIRQEQNKAVQDLKNRTVEKEQAKELKGKIDRLKKDRATFTDKYMQEITSPDAAQEMINTFNRIDGQIKQAEAELEKVNERIETPPTQEEISKLEQEYQGKLDDAVNTGRNDVNPGKNKPDKPKHKKAQQTPPQAPPQGPTQEPPQAPPQGPPQAPPQGPTPSPGFANTGKVKASKRMLRAQADPRFIGVIREELRKNEGYEAISFAKTAEMADWMFEQMLDEGMSNGDIFEAAFELMQDIKVPEDLTQENENRSLKIAYQHVCEAAIMAEASINPHSNLLLTMNLKLAAYMRMAGTTLAATVGGTTNNSLISIIGTATQELKEALDKKTPTGKTLREDLEEIMVGHTADEILEVLIAVEEARKSQQQADQDVEDVNKTSDDAMIQKGKNDIKSGLDKLNRRDIASAAFFLTGDQIEALGDIVRGLLYVTAGNLNKARKRFISLLRSKNYDGAAIWEYLIGEEKIDLRKMQEEELNDRIIATKKKLESQLQANLDKAFDLFSAQELAKISSKDIMADTLLELQKIYNEDPTLGNLDEDIANGKVSSKNARKARENVLKKWQRANRVEVTAIRSSLDSILSSVSKDWSKTTEAQIKQGLRELGMSLDEVVVNHYTKGNVDGKSLAEKLVEALNFSPEEAIEFQKKFQNTWNNMMRTKKEQILERRLRESARILKNRIAQLQKEGKTTEAYQLKQVLKKYQKKKGSEVNRMMEELSLGVVDSEAMAQIWRDKYMVPNLNMKDIQELSLLAKQYYEAKTTAEKANLGEKFLQKANASSAAVGTAALRVMQDMMKTYLFGWPSVARSSVGVLLSTIPQYLAEATALSIEVLKNPKSIKTISFIIGQTFQTKGSLGRWARDVVDNYKYGVQDSRYFDQGQGGYSDFKLFMNRLLNGEHAQIMKEARQDKLGKGIVKALGVLFGTTLGIPGILITRSLGLVDMAVKPALVNFYAAKRVYADLVDAGVNPADADFLVKMKEALGRNMMEEIEAEVDSEIEYLKASGKKLGVGYRRTRIDELRLSKWDTELKQKALEDAEKAVLMHSNNAVKLLSRISGIDMKDHPAKAFGKLIVSSIIPVIRSPLNFVYSTLTFTPLSILPGGYNAVLKSNGKLKKVDANATLVKGVTGLATILYFLGHLFDFEDEEDGSVTVTLSNDWVLKPTGPGVNFIADMQVSEDYQPNTLQYKDSDGNIFNLLEYRDSPAGINLYMVGAAYEWLAFNLKNKQENFSSRGAFVGWMLGQGASYVYQQSFSQSIEDVIELVNLFVRDDPRPGEPKNKREARSEKVDEYITRKIDMFNILAPNYVRQGYRVYNQIMDVPMKDPSDVNAQQRLVYILTRNMPFVDSYINNGLSERYDPFGHPIVPELVIPHNLFFANDGIKYVDELIENGKKISAAHKLVLSKEDLFFPGYYNAPDKFTYKGRVVKVGDKLRAALRKRTAEIFGRMANQFAEKYNLENVPSAVIKEEGFDKLKDKAIERAKYEILVLGL